MGPILQASAMRSREPPVGPTLPQQLVTVFICGHSGATRRVFAGAQAHGWGLRPGDGVHPAHGVGLYRGTPCRVCEHSAHRLHGSAARGPSRVEMDTVGAPARFRAHTPRPRRCGTDSDAASVLGPVRRFDGEYRWHFASDRGFAGDDGEISRWVGAAVDIEPVIRHRCRPFLGAAGPRRGPGLRRGASCQVAGRVEPRGP